MKQLLPLLASLVLLCQCSTLPAPAPEHIVLMPAGLCYLDTAVPGIKVDLKYCGNDNCVGRPIAGYTTGSRAILRRDTAAAMAAAQARFNALGYGILVWDAYRPHRALADFYEWSQTDDDSTRAEFYPRITKKGIYENRYIGHTSEHSWGTAVDITLYDLRTGQELDMGGRHDLLDESAATVYHGLTPTQQANRLLLRDTMAAVGMRNYSKEWWHYFLKNPGTCRRYDFPLLDNMLEQ